MQLVDCRTSTTSSARGDKTPSRSATSCSDAARTGACRRASCCSWATPRSTRATSSGLGDFDFAPTKLIDTATHGDGVRRLVRRRRSSTACPRSPSAACPCARPTTRRPSSARRSRTRARADLPRGGLFVTDIDRRRCRLRGGERAVARPRSRASCRRRVPAQQSGRDVRRALLAKLEPAAVPRELLRARLGRGVGRPALEHRGRDAHELSSSIYVSMNCLNGFLSRSVHDEPRRGAARGAERRRRRRRGRRRRCTISTRSLSSTGSSCMHLSHMSLGEAAMTPRNRSPTWTRGARGCSSATRRCSARRCRRPTGAWVPWTRAARRGTPTPSTRTR